MLILVSSAEQRRVWNELMAREHPQGATRHVGAQVRYLILSRHGCLGAFGFAASALMLAARDRWIGWDPALRAQQLHRVVAMSRFLIRPGVRCHNLASKVLGMCLRRLADDFARRYGYSPLLVETFVDSSCHAGTSLKASNWILVGETCGRGRFAPAGVQVPVKSIYMYPLQPAWREQLGLATRQPIETTASRFPRNGWHGCVTTRCKLGLEAACCVFAGGVHVGAHAQACSAEVGVAHPVAIAFEVLGAPLVPSSVA